MINENSSTDTENTDAKTQVTLVGLQEQMTQLMDFVKAQTSMMGNMQEAVAEAEQARKTAEEARDRAETELTQKIAQGSDKNSRRSVSIGGMMASLP